MKDAAYWIKALQLQEHPEGGYYREIYRSSEQIERAGLPARYGGARPFATVIYYLLSSGEVSHFHRLKSDEIWHFQAGGPMSLYMLYPQCAFGRITLGADPTKGEQLQAVMPVGSWFGATVEEPDSYCLVSCTVAPGFDFADFEMATRRELMLLYPTLRPIIEKLAPPE